MTSTARRRLATGTAAAASRGTARPIRGTVLVADLQPVAALPDWASSLGMVFSIMLWMPSWGGMINGLLTLRGAWNKVSTDPVLKFFVVAITFYGMATFEGPLLSIKSVWPGSQ